MKKTGKEFEKGHKGYYRGKRIDRELFLTGYWMWATKAIPRDAAARLVGISEPTFVKDLNLLFENGYLPGYLMKDGQRLVMDGYTGEFDKYEHEYDEEPVRKNPAKRKKHTNGARNDKRNYTDKHIYNKH